MQQEHYLIPQYYDLKATCVSVNRKLPPVLRVKSSKSRATSQKTTRTTEIHHDNKQPRTRRVRKYVQIHKQKVHFELATCTRNLTLIRHVTYI